MLDTDRAIFTPEEIAGFIRDGMGLDQSDASLRVYPNPTDQQAQVIGSKPSGAYLVVAGAGAGKTETMAARVVWLVANGYVRPEQVLGLTFTRKAASELAHRVRSRLETLANSQLYLGALAADDPRRRWLSNVAPTIATYDSYAGTIVREYGLLVPMEPAGRIIGDAEQWLIAREVVTNYGGTLSVDKTIPSVISDVQALSNEAQSHLVDVDQVREESLSAMRDLEGLESTKKKEPEYLSGENQKFHNAQKQRIELLELVREYRNTLQKRDLMTFDQQMSIAAELVTKHPRVGEEQRQRFRVVMLDEYQDTGQAQRVLLRSLFGEGKDPGLAVTAVGDPMQSIYMFRGATASNLEKFRADFAPAQKLELTTSWRNPSTVLTLANVVSRWSMEDRPLVSELKPRAGSDEGTVRVAFHDDKEQEITWLAQHVAQHWEAWTDSDQAKPFSAAVLVRRNADAVPIYEALRELGVPAEMSAGPGLLEMPEVEQVLSTLRVLVDPSDDEAILRLITSTRWALGAADIKALSDRAKQLQRAQVETEHTTGPADQRLQPLADVFERLDHPAQVPSGSGANRATKPGQTLREELQGVLEDPVAGPVGLGDALADLGEATSFGMSPVGAARLEQLSAELGFLRRHSMSKSLPDLVADIERMLGVRTEVLTRWYSAPEYSIGTSHLDRFAEIVRGFSEISGASASTLVEYLMAAKDKEDGLETGEVTKKDNLVQILTVHKSKGLEWDLVAVPHAGRGTYTDAEAPTTRGYKWTDNATRLPTHLRGDAEAFEGLATMPVLDLSGVEKRSDHSKRVAGFKQEYNRFEAKEDDRVFYVAITRAKKKLLVSGSAYREGSKSLEDPSVGLVLLRNALYEAAGTRWKAAEEIKTIETVPVWSPLGKLRKKEADFEPADPSNPQPGGRERNLMLNDVLAFNDIRQALIDELQQAPARVGNAAPWPRSAAPLLSARPGAEEGAQLVRQALEALKQGSPQGAIQPAASSTATTTGESWDVETAQLIQELRVEETAKIEIPLDVRLTATEAVGLRRDRAEFARRRRRPVPLEPKPYAKRGTAFHNWVEQHYDHVTLLDDEQLPGASDATLQDPALERLKERFLQSEWAARTPASIEGAYSVSLAGHVFEGRIDAVFHFSDDPTKGWMVVDWKTGKKPTGEDMSAAKMQLAVYRLAWAQVLSSQLGVEVPVSEVRAAFHYVQANETVEPDKLPSAREIEQLLTDPAK
ncbi:UvrD-helicase domain-containing protein [Corynebacterium auriscanis]|uniref:UvrD-helicase domain-containing protein n=1 Tax=Corynebacterium auriscanis TaxID=99807 RepID=UPI003CF981E9